MPTPTMSTFSPPSPMRLGTTRSDKMKRHYQQRRFLFVLFSAFVFAAAVYLWVDAAANLSSAAGNLNIKKLNSNIDHRQASNIAEEQSTNNSIVHPASDENVVAFLMNLALKSPSELWTMFGKEENLDDNASYGDDPFLLKYLENGKCPWKDSTNIASDGSADKTTTVEWLPSRPIHSETIAEKFRTKSRTTDQKQQMAAAMRRRNNINQEFDSSNEAILWYEHLSKAGGTSFCELVKLNMPKEKVPRYHCMPSKGKLMDGRVGSWSNKELMEYVSEGPHRIVSSEWEPFSLEKLKLSGRKIRYDTATDDDLSQGQQQLPFEPHVLFLTTLRDPSDRLLSAYTFFGITATKNQNAPPFPQWIKNNVNRVHMYQTGTRSGYRSNTARHNHIVWRFSGGNLPALPTEEDMESDRGRAVRKSSFPSPVTDVSVWVPPFQTAIRALTLHDLILPMDYMTKDEGKESMRQLLGWTKFEIQKRGSTEGKVVTQGGVKNSNARNSMEDEEYRALWEANWLDNILFLWCKAVFLARFYCKDVIVEQIER